MITEFDRIIIEVPALEDAAAAYSALLGAPHFIDDVVRFPLQNICIELCEPSHRPQPWIAGLSMVDDTLAPGVELAVASTLAGRGLTRCGSRHYQRPTTASQHEVYAVDHLVLHAADADRCIDLFGDDGLGLRLALDQSVPEWGGRMLFFRAGKLTLEVIHNINRPAPHDHFWGITYLCRDIELTIAALDACSVAHSPIRDGRKPGTRVATIKSHCLELPTMLLQPHANTQAKASQ